MSARLKSDEAQKKQADRGCFQPCSIEIGMRILGGKWTGSILWHLKDGPVRFNDLSRMIGGASKKMITERLRQLEAQGLVDRKVMQTSPVSVEYSLTDFGCTALGFLEKLRQWSETLPDRFSVVD
ncbi:winged helix-turn-helix transcriptional regulator [Ruegeria meonggei]|uniref:winged helix-turn-helix transcriptional regulator n=1 Tax=Ruegeria meonggei TaxID=1446476 RepID=UPI00366F0D10